MEPPAAIKPGQKVEGFRIDSNFLPGIRGHFLAGWIPPASEDEIVNEINRKKNASFTNLDEIPDDVFKEVVPGFRPLRESTVHGFTIVPDLKPEGAGAASLLHRLEDLKHEAQKQGWIGRETAEELDEELTEALLALERGKKGEARESLREFLEELQEARGEEDDDDDNEGDDDNDDDDREEFLDQNAFMLLKPNAVYILQKFLK
jgi:hypothetical protein